MYRKDLPLHSEGGKYTQDEIEFFNQHRRRYQARVAWWEGSVDRIPFFSPTYLQRLMEENGVMNHPDSQSVGCQLIGGLVLHEGWGYNIKGCGSLKKCSPPTNGPTNSTNGAFMMGNIGCDMITAFYLPENTERYYIHYVGSSDILTEWRKNMDDRPLQDLLDEAHRLPPSPPIPTDMDLLLAHDGRFKRQARITIDGVSYRRVVLCHPFICSMMFGALDRTYLSIVPEQDFYAEVVQLEIPYRENLAKEFRDRLNDFVWLEMPNGKGRLKVGETYSDSPFQTLGKG